MRVALVCADPGVPVFGRKGASVHVQEVARALVHRGADIVLIAARVEGALPPGLESVQVERLPPLPRGDLRRRERAALAGNTDLRDLLERAGPFDLVYERYSLWSFGALEWAEERTVPALLEVNAPLAEEQLQHRDLIDRRGAEAVAARAFGAATALLAVSEAVAGFLERHATARGRVHVVPNGVDPRRFSPPPARLRTGPFTVGFVGSLKPWHGLDVLVEAFAAVHASSPAARLLIVGDGPERERLTADLGARGLLKAATLTGAVAPEQVPARLAAVDVAIAPYPNTDGFYFSPLKVYEYMAAGLAVVASRVGQLAELIEDGVDGLLCPPGDAASLAEAIERLRTDDALRARLGAAARRTAERAHTWDAIAERILVLAGLDPLPKAEGAH